MHEVQDALVAGEVPGRLRSSVVLGRRQDDGVTFTLWRDEVSASAWAYRGATHAPMIARQRREELMPRSSFTRFGILRAFGAWAGSDPLTGR